jgi:hypothetical protein
MCSLDMPQRQSLSVLKIWVTRYRTDHVIILARRTTAHTTLCWPARNVTSRRAIKYSVLRYVFAYTKA